MDRLEILKGMAAQNPGDKLVQYGLAMEHKNRGEFSQAVEEFRALLNVHPEYAAAYYHGGQALEQAGRIDEAREIYRAGIDVTARTGDGHTRAELQAALDLL